MTTSNSRSHWFLFTSLYTTQYLGLAFLMIALISILRQKGYTLEQLSAVYMLSIPWMFKFLWAPVVDRFAWLKIGHYRGWLLLMQTIMVATLLILAQLSVDTQLQWIIIVGSIFVFCSATQDIATDALASKTFSEGARGQLNSLQSGGGLLGNLLGGGVVLMLYPTIGWEGAFYLMAVVTTISLVQIGFFKESAHEKADNNVSFRQTFLRTVTFWPKNLTWLLQLLILPIGFAMAYGIFSPLLIDAGKSLPEIGLILNVYGSFVGISASLLAGVLIKKWGRRHALMTFALIQAVGLALLLPITSSPETWTIYACIGVYFIFYPFIEVILSTLMMDKVAESVTPGTDYTIQFSVKMIMGMMSAGAALKIADMYGYHNVILTSIGVAVIAFITVCFYSKKSGK